jgi:conjugal transfer ATP-binding protein TraC
MKIETLYEQFKARIASFFRDEGKDVEAYVPSAIENPTVSQQYTRFSDLLPFVAWDDDQRLFFLEGATPDEVEAVGFVLELTPQTGATKEMADLLSGMFPVLVPQASVQFILAATPQIDGFLSDYVSTRVRPDEMEAGEERERAMLYQELARRRVEFYRQGAIEPVVPSMPYLLRRFRAAIAICVPVKSQSDVRGISDALEIREIVIQMLRTYHQFQREWDAEDLINWCSVMLNPQRTMMTTGAPYINYDDGRAIKHQIVDPDTVIRVTDTGMRFGLPQHGNEMQATVLSVKSYPKAQTLNAMSALIGDAMQTSLGYACPFVMTLVVQVQDFERARTVTQMKNARATQRAESPMAKFMPDLQDVKADWNLAQASFDEGIGTVKMIHQVVLYAPPRESHRAIQAAQAVWRAMNFELVPDTFMQVQGLMCTLPLATTPSLMEDVRKAQRMTTKTGYNAICTAPILGEWWGVGSPVMALWGRRGQAMSVDVFANSSGNFNACVVGTSGSGKSVFLNDAALSTVACGGRVWIIDQGRSYEKICHLVGGQFIEFGPDSGVCLNPWSLVNPDTWEEDMEMLVPLFAQMISPNAPLDNYLKSQLTQHIQSVWFDKGNLATVDDLAQSLINNCEKGGANPMATDLEFQMRVRQMSKEERDKICDPRVRDLGVQLFPYTQDGPYGRYFYGQANVKFTSPYIVLETEELAVKKELQAVVMFLLMFMITREMYFSPRTQRKLCIIDEAWSVLRGGASGEFIESGYRRARKYAGSFWTGTQSAMDYQQSPAAQAAMANSDWLFMLRQKPESVMALAKSDKLVIDQHMQDQLLSLKTITGAYSEVFVHGGQMGHGVGRLMLDPFTLLLFSSKAEDYEAIMAYRRAGMPIADAVNQVLVDREAQRAASLQRRRA